MFRNIVILGFVSLLADVSSEMIYPLLPYFLIYVLGSGIYAIGIIEGIAESTASLLKVFFGIYSDRIKKRKFFAFWGYLFSFFGKIFLLLASSWGGVLFSRFVDRIGKGVRTAPRDALIVESSEQNKRGASFGLHRALDTLGAVLGVGIAFVVLRYFSDSIRNIFLLSLIPAILSALLVLAIKEKNKEKTPIKEKINFKEYFDFQKYPKNLKIFLLISFIFTIGNSSNLFLILKAINIGFAPIYALLLYMTYNITHSLFSYPAAKLSDKIGRKKILILAYFLFGLVYLGFSFINFKTAYWFLFLLYGIYGGLSEGVEKAFVSDYTPKNLKATVLGAHATIVGVTLLPASILTGFLWKYFGPNTPFFFSSLTAFLSIILLIKYIKRPFKYENS